MCAPLRDTRQPLQRRPRHHLLAPRPALVYADAGAALRAVEINAEVLLKGTKVDGVYSADPMKDPTATFFEKVSFDTVIEKNLQVMDMTAFTMCRENNLPIIVFNILVDGNLQRIVDAQKVGTLVSAEGGRISS